MQFQFRSIVRLAKKNKMSFGKGYNGFDGKGCVLAVIGRNLLGEDWYGCIDDHRSYGELNGVARALARATGLDGNKLAALECGYENWDANPRIRNHPQFKVGQRLRKLDPARV